MSDKKANIKDGKNIELDGVTVINEGVSLVEVEKEEVKEETNPKTEVAREESNDTPDVENTNPTEQENKIIPDVKITPEATMEPEVPYNVDVPQIDINSVLPEVGNVDLPSIEPNGEEQEQSAFNYDNSVVSQTPAFNFEQSNEIGASPFAISNNSQQEPQNYASEQSSNMFGDAYADSYEKVEATVVTEADAKEAKNAFIDTMNKVYDSGPGRQIEILRNVAEAATKWIDEVVEKGFVSGPMHESAKKIMNDYHGLRLKDEPSDTNNYTNEEQPKFYDEAPTEQYTDFNNDFNSYNNVA